MFTDVVDSTAQRQRLGERSAEELRISVDALQSDLFHSNGGRVVKHLGDGMMAAFESASGALQCATGIQVELERMRKRLPEPVQLRIGISAGDVSEEDGDLFGMPVVQAARLCNAADDGAILVADLVRELIGRDPDVELGHPTPMALKGLDDEIVAWRLGWEAVDGAAADLPTGLHRDDRFGFVGRASEWSTLSDAWTLVVGGEIQIATVTGEAGVGKTRLVAEFAEWVNAGGGSVLFGSNDENLDVPYQPFVEILRQFVADQPDWAISRRLGRSRAELVRLLPELSEHVDDLEPRAAADPQAERFRMFEAVSHWLTEASAAQPLLLVIDDLHWASESTLQMLRHLAASREAPAVLIIATQRPSTATGASSPSLPIPPRRAQHVSLANFDPQTVLDFMEAAAGHSLQEAGPPLAERIHSQTGGNAFFCRELALHLVDTGVLVQADGRWSVTVPLDEVGIPDTIRRVVDERLDRVPDSSRQTLLWAAVLGQEVDVTLLTGVVDASEDAVLDALDQCVDARLLEERGLDRYFFPHALARSTLLDSIGRTRRRSMHRRIAAKLLARRDSGVQVPIGELARHFELGAAEEQFLQAVELCEEAGHQATEQLAHEAAVEYFERSVELFDRAPGSSDDPGRRSDLETVLAGAAGRAGDPRAAQLARHALVASERSGDPVRMAEALLASSRGAASVTGAVDPERVGRLEDVCDRLPSTDHALRARLLAVLGTEMQFTGETERVAELGDQALAMARRLDDPETLLFVLVERLAAIRHPNRLDAQLADVVELGRLSRAVRDERAEFFAAYRGSEIHLAVNDLVGFRADVETAQRISNELGQPALQARMLRITQERAWLCGDLDEAERKLDEFWGVVTDMNQERQYLASYLGARSKIASTRGRPEVAVESFAELAALPKGTDGFRAGLAVANELAGDREQASALYERLIEKGVERIAHDLTRVHTLCYVASVCASLGDVDRSESIGRQLRPYVNLWVVSGANSYGPVIHFLARLDALSGRHDDAAAAFVDASRRCQTMEAPLLEAWNQVAWSGFLSAAGDLAGARDLAERAEAVAVRHGAAGIATEARVRLRDVDARRSERG